jgi:AraC family transcriptional regulator
MITNEKQIPRVNPHEAGESVVTPERTSALGLERHIAGQTLISGDSPAWNDIFVQVYTRLDKQKRFLVPAVAEPLVVWVISGRALVEERDLHGDWVANTVTVGDFFLTRSPTPYEMRWSAIGDAPFQVMHLYLSIPLFERVAFDVLHRAAPPALRDVSGGKDEQLSHLLALIYQELTTEGEGSQLFVQGLAQSLTVHLIRNYANLDVADDRQNALPGFKLRRAVAYLEDHLAEPFKLVQLAESVGMSAFHFSRLFKKATGLSPSRYFIRQRIVQAQLLLQETDRSIIEIGMSVGYSSPSHFAQVFRRETGLLPSHYRLG